VTELRCSFCHKRQEVVQKLISSPSDHPRAYICNECIAVCNSILEDDRNVPARTPQEEPDTPASELMEAIADWIRAESLGRDAADELGRVREMARRMI
jgi:ATP-dependent Clp protease ATP-binding subunit ClpX